MNLIWPPIFLVQGLVAGVVTLVVLAVRAAIDGQPGVSFGDLLTAVAVGVAVAVVPWLSARIVFWRFRRRWGPGEVVGLGGYSSYGDVDQGVRLRSRSRASDRFDRFTGDARKVLTLAQDEAQRFNHPYIGTEHLLLGLVREREGTGAQILEDMGFELPKIRTAIEFIMGRGDRPVVGEVGLAPMTKQVIELAIDEARRLGHDYVGTEHLLLGLIREGNGIAATVLESLNVSLDRARNEVERLTSDGNGSG